MKERNVRMLSVALIISVLLSGCSDIVTGPSSQELKNWNWEFRPLATGGWDYDCEDSFVEEECEGPPLGYEPDDTPSQGSVPSCNPAPTDWGQIAWCRGSVPQGDTLVLINAALARLNAKGPPCSVAAAAVQTLINAGKLRVYNWTTGDGGGGAPVGGDWAVFSWEWVSWGTALDPEGLNTDAVLVHEMDHHLSNITSQTDGVGHKIENGSVNGSHTLNSRACV